MSRDAPGRTKASLGFQEALVLLEAALAGGFRGELVETLLGSSDDEEAFSRLRSQMAAHTFRTPSGGLALRPLVREFDRRTQRQGFQVLKDWDGRAQRFRREIIPVDMLDYVAARPPEDRDPAGTSPGAPTRPPGFHRARASRALPVLLDYYFLYLLALVILRAWDDGDPNRNMDGIGRLLEALQGPQGSGRRMVVSPEILLWIAISNYHPDDEAYDRLLERVRELDAGHRLSFAHSGAAVLGTHLRWGFEAFYRRDLGLLRRDNFADYPWLLFSLATLMERYHRMREEGTDREERRRVVLALLNGLTADPPAFTGEPPPALAAYREEQGRFRELFHRHREALLEEFEAFRPSGERYSPIAFHFNFPHNALKALVAMELTGWNPPNLPLDALFGEDTGTGEPSAETLAKALMDHSRANPEEIGPRRVMVLTYMPRTGLRRFRAAIWGEGDPEAKAAEEGKDATSRLVQSPFQRGSR